MSESEREARFQDAISKLKWWSEIVGIFSSWAIVIGVTLLSLRTIERMPSADDPDYNFVLAMANNMTFLAVVFVFVIYTSRTAWLVYCWVSKLHKDGGGWLTRGSDYFVTAVTVCTLVIGMFSIAATVANLQMSFD